MNKDKSTLYVSFENDDPRIIDIKRITCFSHYQYPMIYFGCFIYLGRQKVVYFNIVVAKRLYGCQEKLFSHRGRIFLIKSVYMLNLYIILSVVHPHKTVIYQMEKIITNFLWGQSNNWNMKYWIAWEDLCFLENEEVGFRDLNDICKAFSTKLW